jgi:hypothetical protein
MAGRDGKISRAQAVEIIAGRYLEWAKVFEGCKK